MPDRDGVNVHVGDPGCVVGLLGDLVHVPLGGDPGPMLRRTDFTSGFEIHFFFRTKSQGTGNGCRYRVAARRERLAAIAGQAAARGRGCWREDWCRYL